MPALLTPVDKGNARQSGATLWRKQLLPVGEIDYKGRKIAFTREYLAGLVKAFNTRAYDQVPFQLADGQNTHTNDPERFRGEVRGLEMTGDGLDIIISATDDGAALLQKNPALGVSARIVEDYQRADGRFFPAAIQHVLGTLDPRIPGMRPWQAVEAANDDDGEVIDLTVFEYATDEDPETVPAAPVKAPPAQKEASMAFTDEEQARLAKLLALPDEKFNALLSVTQAPADVHAAPEAADGATDAELTDAELEELLAGMDEEPAVVEVDLPGRLPGMPAEPEPEKVLAVAGAELSADARDAIELANARNQELQLSVQRMRKDLDRATYEKERDHFAREYGIPPRITDLARSVLEGEGRTVDLANGKTADAGQVVRSLLKEIGTTVKMLDLSAELGSGEGMDLAVAAEEQAAAERSETVKAFRNMTGV